MERHALVMSVMLLTMALVKHQALPTLIADLKIGACALGVVALVYLVWWLASTSLLHTSRLLNLLEQGFIRSEPLHKSKLNLPFCGERVDRTYLELMQNTFSKVVILFLKIYVFELNLN